MVKIHEISTAMLIYWRVCWRCRSFLLTWKMLHCFAETIGLKCPEKHFKAREVRCFCVVALVFLTCPQEWNAAAAHPALGAKAAGLMFSCSCHKSSKKHATRAQKRIASGNLLQFVNWKITINIKNSRSSNSINGASIPISFIIIYYNIYIYIL